MIEPLPRGLLGAVALLPCLLILAIACSPEEEGDTGEEERTVTRTVVEEVTVPEEESGSGEPGSVVEETSEDLSPEETLSLQYQYMSSGEYERAYELFTEDSRQEVLLEQFRAYFEATAPYEVVDHSFPSVEVQGDSATVETAVTVSTGTAGIEEYQRAQELELTDEGWRVVMRDEQIESFRAADQEPAEQEQPSDDPDGTDVVVRVTGNEPFSGNYGTLESSRTVDGVAPEEYPVELDTGFFSMDSVVAIVQKTEPGSGELGVEVVVDGEVVRETSTTAEFGLAEVSWSPDE